MRLKHGGRNPESRQNQKNQSQGQKASPPEKSRKKTRRKTFEESTQKRA